MPDIMLILIWGKLFAKVTKDKSSKQRVKLVVVFGEVIFVNLGITSTFLLAQRSKYTVWSVKKYFSQHMRF